MRESMDRIARFFDIEYEDFEADLPIIEAFAQRTGGPLLELGCGTGRLLTPLARRGYHVTGVDISPAMLRLAGAKADAAAVAERITLVEGDYSAVALAGRFQFAFTVMNTFMYLVEQETQLRALRHWRGHLAPNGMLLIDVFNPDVAQLAGLDGRLEVDTIWSDPQTGATVMKLISRTVDLAEQTVHVTVMYDEITADGTIRRTLAPFAMRYVWRAEAELLLRHTGFALEEIYGDWEMSPFDGNSERMILLARRDGE